MHIYIYIYTHMYTHICCPSLMFADLTVFYSIYSISHSETCSQKHQDRTIIRRIVRGGYGVLCLWGTSGLLGHRVSGFGGSRV